MDAAEMQADALTFTVLADIRAILGVGMKPMLEELPALVRAVKDRADAAPQPLALTTGQVRALRRARLTLMADPPSEEELAAASEQIKKEFPAAFQGEWWEEA